MLGLGSNLSKVGLSAPRIVTDNLVLKHKYNAGEVVPISDGAAYFFNVDHINISAVTMDTDGNCSFVFWARRTEVSSEDAVIGHTSTAGFQILRFNSNTTMALESASSDEATITLNSPNDFNWHHYAIICTSGTVTAYQDGVSCSVANAAMASDTTFNLIGAASTDGDSKNFQGYLCNVGLWSRAITAAEVKSIMNKNYAGLASSEKTNLVSWWNLDTTLGGSGGTSVVVNSHDNTLGEELITGFVNGSTYVFDTLTTSGRNISAAVETSGDWAGAASNSLNLVEGEIYKCTFNLTYNSGTDTVRVLLTNTANGAATSVVDEVYYTNTNGVNEAYFRVKTTDSESFLQIGTWHSSDVINFNMTDISLKRLGGTTGELTD